MNIDPMTLCSSRLYIKESLVGKVDRVDGKVLTTNDLTNELKNKYDSYDMQIQELEASVRNNSNSILDINSKVDSINEALIEQDVVSIDLNVGNLGSIMTLSTTSANYIKYVVKNGICIFDISFYVYPSSTSSKTANSKGGTAGVWIDLNHSVPKPLISARCQAVSVQPSSNSRGVANIRVDENGSILVLIVNPEDSYCWLQNGFCYPIA